MNKEFLTLIAAIVLAIFGIVSIQPQHPDLTEFEQFKWEHGKSYANDA